MTLGASQFWGGNSGEYMAAVAEVERQGAHKGCPYGEYLGLAGRGWAHLFRMGTCYE